MRVSLIIPVYNESGHLRDFLSLLDKSDLGLPKELIFVDDASKDGSVDILKAFAFESEHKIFLQEKNQGKGAALRRGIAEASGEILLIQDADFEYDVEDLPMLIAPNLKGKADVVYGSRFRKNVAQVHRTFHYLANRFLTLISNVVSGLYVTDMETCYKVFRTDIVKNIHLQSNRFGFEPEITAKLASLKIRTEEYPIRYFPRNYMEGKKIGWKDGVAAVWHILFFNCFARKANFFKASMPERYKVMGNQWL